MHETRCSGLFSLAHCNVPNSFLKCRKSSLANSDGVEQYAKPGHSPRKCAACTFVVRAAYAAAEARHRVFQHPFVKPQARRRINAA